MYGVRQPALTSPRDGFTFARLSDRTGLARPGVFERAVEMLNWLRPDFVVQLSDLVEGYKTDENELTPEPPSRQSRRATSRTCWPGTATCGGPSCACTFPAWQGAGHPALDRLRAALSGAGEPSISDIVLDGVLGVDGGTYPPSRIDTTLTTRGRP